MGQTDFLNQRRKRHEKNWLSSKKITKWGLGPWEPTINIHYIWFDTVFFQKRLHHYRMDFDLPVSRKSKMIVKVRVWSLHNGFLIFDMVLFADTCFSTDDSMWKSWDKKYSKLILGQIFWEAHSASPARLLPSLPPHSRIQAQFISSIVLKYPSAYRHPTVVCLAFSCPSIRWTYSSWKSAILTEKKSTYSSEASKRGFGGYVEYAFT